GLDARVPAGDGRLRRGRARGARAAVGRAPGPGDGRRDLRRLRVGRGGAPRGHPSYVITRLGVLVLLGLVAATPALAAPAPPPVEPRFEPDVVGRAPFPSDRFTIVDPAQRTGLRVALPSPSCAVDRSACDDVRLLDEQDGFDLDPRLSVPFTGPI